MIIGVSQIDITPEAGVELSGFAARVQPSTGVLDRLFASALYLQHQGARLLWLHADLIGFDRNIVTVFRKWAAAHLGLREGQVMLSATHTHSGPCTIHLQEAGKYDPSYVETLLRNLQAVSTQAMASLEEADLVSVEAQLELAVDRRASASAHTDPLVTAMGFRRSDGSFVAALLNYAVHPVSLGPVNRLISGDLSGQASRSLSQQLKGHPVVLMTNGASANLNPPAENVTPQQAQEWGRAIADSVAGLLSKAQPVAPQLRILQRVVRLPLDVFDVERVHTVVEEALRSPMPLAQWGEKYKRVVKHWRASVLAELQAGTAASHREAELYAVSLGPLTMLGMNAEVFSEFSDWLRAASNGPVCVIGYANGDLGYLPTRTAYSEGGYEVEVAYFFYGGFRPKPGGLELLAKEAIQLLRSLDEPELSPLAASELSTHPAEGQA